MAVNCARVRHWSSNSLRSAATHATTRPASRQSIWSASPLPRSTWCVAMSTVVPCAFNWRTTSSTSANPSGSSCPYGSSSRTTCGRCMRKRLSFARVLLQEPQIVLLDEPYGQLDPEGFALVDEVVRQLKAQGTTVLMATHQVERGRGWRTQMLCLEAGRVVAC